MVPEGPLSRIIEEAILEDIGMGDITTESIVPDDLPGRGSVRVKEEGIVAGLEIAGMVFGFVDPDISFARHFKDGSFVDAGTIAAVAEGRFGSILKAERTVLNIVQRMSGIATMTKKFVDAVKGTRAKITDTRKTAPGLRIVDKLAVAAGGGVNHRFGLDDMVLIKDNHIAAAGGIGNAIGKCLAYIAVKKYNLRIEVETRDLSEVKEALKHKGIHRIMLDNFSLNDMEEAVKIVDRRIEVEASGNVSLANVRGIAEAGVDFISVGALTHSPKALDISLKTVPLPLTP